MLSLLKNISSYVNFLQHGVEIKPQTYVIENIETIIYKFAIESLKNSFVYVMKITKMSLVKKQKKRMDGDIVGAEAGQEFC